MAKVIVLKDFTDKQTKKRHIANSEAVLTDSRALELIDKGFVSPLVETEKVEKSVVNEKSKGDPTKGKKENKR